MDLADTPASHHWIYRWRNPAIVGALLAIGTLLFVPLDTSLILPKFIASPLAARLPVAGAPDTYEHGIYEHGILESAPPGITDDVPQVAEGNPGTVDDVTRERIAPNDKEFDASNSSGGGANVAPAPAADVEPSESDPDSGVNATQSSLSSSWEPPTAAPSPTPGSVRNTWDGDVSIAPAIPDVVVATSPASPPTADVSNTPRPPLKSDCRPPLKVYMYDLPRKFNFGLMASGDGDSEAAWRGPIPGLHGGNKIQYAVSYYLTADLLETQKNSCTSSLAERVSAPESADVFFVPFFSSLSAMFSHGDQRGFNSDYYRQVQIELVQFLNTSVWWHRSGGRDHVIPSLNPNALKSVRDEVAQAILVVVDLDRYSLSTGRLSKDIIAPYVHLLPLLQEPLPLPPGRAAEAYGQRPTLLFFQGTVQPGKKSGEVRLKVSEVLRGEEDVVSAAKKASKHAKEESAAMMAHSKFCLHLRGDTGSSCRLFDAIARLCVPVIVSDFADLPFEDELRYSDFALFFPEEKAVQPGALAAFVRQVTQSQWESLWTNLTSVQHHFQYEVPASQGTAVDMIWDQVVHKLPIVRLAMSRRERLLVPEWWKLTGEDMMEDPRTFWHKGGV